MPELRAVLTDAGFKDVRTYVQSGNVVLTSGVSANKLGAQSEKLIAERFGFDVDVIVRTADELAEVVARNPLADVADNPKRYQVSFLDGEPDPEAVEKIAAAAAPTERLVAIGRELYAWHPDGVGRSKMWTKLAGHHARRPRHRAQLDDGDDAARDGGRVVSMRRYTIADVFTDVPLQGNQVAVFTDATGLSDETMQRAAREMNLSETVFVFRTEDPNAHLRVRIFTPATELPFAGHPVLGTAFVVGRAMGSNVVRLETGLGIVPVTLERAGNGALTYGEMEQFVPAVEPFDAVDELVAALGAAPDHGALPIEGYPQRAGARVRRVSERGRGRGAEAGHRRARAPRRPTGSTASRARASGGRRGCSGRRWAWPRIRPPARRPGRSPCTWRGTVGCRSGPRSRSSRASRSGVGRCSARGSREAPSGSSGCSSAGRR